MLFKALSFLLVISSVFAEVPSEARLNTDRALLDLMMQPRGDAAVDAYCWGRYTPVMKEIIDVFEAESKQCQTDYDLSNAAIIANYTGLRENVTAIAKDSCESLQRCDGLQTQLEAFNCFGTTGRDQAQKLTSMSGTSFSAAISLEEEISRIISVQKLCSEKALARYSNDNSQALKELTECLNGNISES
ncbi:uncharacterized protein LOC117574575 [Drosophila albomicans]|uniref:Uncharacterized protein LOC117574575 n=1 Tax=Drosophila albomicans TaxID=7291 RepID=A0A6P8XMW0_DROAB|nr:uncharacterized protein LOC117574575 [Drosophila albomicans]